MSDKFSNVRRALENGLLSFPITDFDQNGKFNGSSYKERIAWFLSHDISAVFVAGGTGEFFSVSKTEYKEIIKTATAVADKKVPIISSVGRSIPDAVEHARLAEQAGIDGLLLMPPYLTEASQDGIYQYTKSIMDQTSLPVVYYNRSNGVLSAKYLQRLADECENLVGLKDGTGNIQELNDTIKTIGDRLVYIGGVPTAEIISEAYLSIGVNTYSSAVFNFVPDLANKFYKSLRAGDRETVNSIIRDFFIPFVRLRGRKQGYAVSLIKAGAEIMGRSGGDVRAPLTMPTTEEREELKKIIEAGTRHIAA